MLLRMAGQILPQPLLWTDFVIYEITANAGEKRPPRKEQSSFLCVWGVTLMSVIHTMNSGLKAVCLPETSIRLLVAKDQVFSTKTGEAETWAPGREDTLS